MIIDPNFKTDNQILQEAVPIHLMFLTCEFLQKSGWELRADTLDAINKASLIPFKDVAEWRLSKLAAATDDIAQKLLRELSLDKPQHYPLAVCYLVLFLVSEGMWKDPKHVIVLISLGLLDEAKDHSDWEFDERLLQFKAKFLFTQLRLNGLYLTKGLIV